MKKRKPLVIYRQHKLFSKHWTSNLYNISQQKKRICSKGKQHFPIHIGFSTATLKFGATFGKVTGDLPEPNLLPKEKTWHLRFKAATQHLAKDTIKFSVLANTQSCEMTLVKIGGDLLLLHLAYPCQAQLGCQRHWKQGLACYANLLVALRASACSPYSYPDRNEHYCIVKQ